MITFLTLFKLLSFLSKKPYSKFRIRKYGSIIGSLEEFEKELRLKRNNRKYNVKVKLEKHLTDKGLDKMIVSELMKNTCEKLWPNAIKTDKLRNQNKNIIETYS